MTKATRPDQHGIARPAYSVRRQGFVTYAMIQRYGSFRQALAVLNGQAA
jgi:hypothetical protein